MDATKQKADEKGRMSDLSVLDLKSQRNTVAPIYKLSNEILLQIFDMLKDDVYTLPSANHLARGFLTKHIMVKVCKHWRDIAFGTTAFWTRPPLGNDYWGVKYLELSKAAPLDVKIFFTKEPMLSAALTQMPRIKILSIEFYKKELTRLQRFLQEGKALHAPTLESLEIHSRVESKADTTSFVLSPNTFRRAGALKKLSFINVAVDWAKSHLLQGQLTTLKLVDITPKLRPTWKQLMDVLRRMPTLEVLKLSKACPLQDAVHSTTDPVHLPNLRALSIDCEGVGLIGVFLSQITFPQLRTIGIGYHNIPGEGPVDYTAVFDYLSRLMPSEKPLRDGGFSTMKVGEGFRKRRLHEGSRIHITLEDHNTATTVQTVHLHLPCRQQYQTNPEMSSIVSFLDIDKLRFLGFYSTHFTGTLNQCFSNLKALEELELGQDAGELPSLIDGLEIPAEHPSGAPIQFPKLRMIRLTEVHLPWRNNHRDMLYDPWELNPRITWTQLRDCLVERAKHGSPIEELYVEECVGFSRKMIDFFLEVIPTVVVDGVRQHPQSEEADAPGKEADEGEDSDEDDGGWW